MDSVLLHPPLKSRSPDPVLSPETCYEPMLREYVDRFLAGIHRDGFDFAGFRSVMWRHLHSRADPPLEIAWLYSAVSYHESIASKKDAFNRVSAVRDLLQLLPACSAASGGVKCIALIAPAVHELYQCAVEDGLEEKKAVKEIECLAEGILSYISICSSQYNDLEGISTGLHSCFLDLVRVWTPRSTAIGGSLEAFFPLVSCEVRKRFEMEGCVVGYLSAVVIAQAFLLRLILKVKAGGPSWKELQKELGIWAVSSITVFHNRCFFEILLKLLLDRKVVATTLLSAEEEKLVRGVLYDAVILVDYSFLYTAKVIGQHDSMINFLVTKLVVTHEAVKLSRAKGDHSKAISYLNSFSTSSLPSELIKWVCKQIGNVSSEKPNDNTPGGLLKWLAHLEQMGQRIFEDETLRIASKLIVDESALVTVDSMSAGSKKADADFYFFDRGESNDAEMGPMDAAFSAAAQSMKQVSNNGRVKRKEPRDVGKRLKFVKYDSQSPEVQAFHPPITPNGTSSDSEVENPLPGEDMEESD